MRGTKPISVGDKWVDAKGRTWVVTSVLCFGRYMAATTDRKHTAEMGGDRIRMEMARQKKK